MGPPLKDRSPTVPAGGQMHSLHHQLPQQLQHEQFFRTQQRQLSLPVPTTAVSNSIPTRFPINPPLVTSTTGFPTNQGLATPTGFTKSQTIPSVGSMVAGISQQHPDFQLPGFPFMAGNMRNFSPAVNLRRFNTDLLLQSSGGKRKAESQLKHPKAKASRSQSKSHQSQQQPSPSELPAFAYPGSSPFGLLSGVDPAKDRTSGVAYPGGVDVGRGSSAPQFAIAPSSHQHHKPTATDSSQRLMSRRSTAAKNANNENDNEEESVDDPTFVPPPWTEPQDSNVSAAAKAGTTVSDKSTLSEKTAVQGGGLKVRSDILKTPLDRLQQLGRSLEPERHGEDEAEGEEADETEQDGGAPRSTIDCPVCGDVAIAHFHYGGMCCYSCKAFFRRVVNTSKATKYKCRSGNNKCDVSLANRRSCQACRYKKCLSAGMKPGLVLSDDQCQRRFGPRKGTRDERFAQPPSTHRFTNNNKEMEGGEAADDPEILDVTCEDLAVLIDGEKSYEEQNRMGRILFVNLFDTGSVSSERTESSELKNYEDINETVAMIRSFQVERQLHHARKFLPFHVDKEDNRRTILTEAGAINTGDIVQTLVDQTIFLLKHNKDFNKISLSDQTELLEANLLTATLLSVYEVYSPVNHTITWTLAEQDFTALARQGIKVLHGRASFGLSDVIAKVDGDLKEDVIKVFKFFDYFSHIGLPRSALYVLLLVIVFNQDCSDVKEKDEIEKKRRHFLLSLFETLVPTEGVLGACTIAARLHTALNDLNRIAQLLGQKFINVTEN